MEVDFENFEDYASVPPGIYLCEITQIREGVSRGGDPLWGLCLRVAEGKHVGHLACWDNLVFSARGRARVRDVFSALGLPSQGRVEIDSQDLIGRRAFVEVRRGEYLAEGQSVPRQRNEVPYAGYQPVPTGPNQPERHHQPTAKASPRDEPTSGEAPPSTPTLGDAPF